MKRTPLLVCSLVLGVATSGCVQHIPTKVQPVQAIQAQTDIPEQQLLDVGIEVFDPGIEPELELAAEEAGLYLDVRKAEARFTSYHLRDTLQKTGQWGAVWLTPSEGAAVDVMVEGTILKSDGEFLEVAVSVSDASGRRWFSKEYKEQVYESSYRDGRALTEEPFQNIYNRISNDMLTARDGLSTEEVARIRDISTLRYAGDIAPDAFSSYLDKDRRGRYSVTRLPAENDPMLTRILSVREREYAFVDTLNDHYAVFYEDMADDYEEYRKISYPEAVAYRELKKQALQRKILGVAAAVGGVLVDANTDSTLGSYAGYTGLLAGIGIFKSGMDRNQEAKLHAEVMKELTASFDGTVEAQVVEVEGRTAELQGSADAQFQAWRDLLREIYAAETGFSVEAAEESDQLDEPIG